MMLYACSHRRELFNIQFQVCFVVHMKQVVLVHDTQSNDSRSNDAWFMHKLYLSLHAHKQTGEGIHPITSKDSKILMSNSNQSWFPSLETKIRYILSTNAHIIFSSCKGTKSHPTVKITYCCAPSVMLLVARINLWKHT